MPCGMAWLEGYSGSPTFFCDTAHATGDSAWGTSRFPIDVIRVWEGTRKTTGTGWIPAFGGMTLRELVCDIVRQNDPRIPF